MRLLVTGATSLLGRTVALQLAARGDDVTTLQRGSGPAELRQVRGDIRDPVTVDRACRGQDGVVHLAALVAPRARWSDAYGVNVLGTRNLLDAAAHVERFVHISTPSVAFHDAPSRAAGAEAADYSGNDAYARSKAIAERLVLRRTSELGRTTVILRPHLVWGPGDTQLVGRIVDRARAGRLVLPDGGRALVDSTYLDDAAAAIVAGVDACRPASPALGRPWVVTGDDPRPVRELLCGIVEAAGLEFRPRSVPAPLAAWLGRAVDAVWSGVEPPVTHFAARQLSVAHWFDQREVHAVLGWRPTTSVDQGLAALAAWYAEA